MSQSSPAENISSLVAGYVLGTLDDVEAEMFAQLVLEDPTVLEEVDQMQAVLEQTYAIEEIAPPSQLREKVLAASATSAAVAQPTSLFSQPLQPQPLQLPEPTVEQPHTRWRKAALATLATVLGLSALTNFVLWRQLNQQIATAPNNQTVEQSAESLDYRLTSTEPAETGTAEVTVDPASLTAQIQAQELPAIAPDKTYVLWAVLNPEAPFTTDEKGAILTTAFQVDEQGNASETTSVPAVFRQPELIVALGITVESADSPQSHTGAPVLLSPL